MLGNQFPNQESQKNSMRPNSIIDEYEELKAAERGQLSSPTEEPARRGSNAAPPRQMEEYQQPGHEFQDGAHQDDIQSYEVNEDRDDTEDGEDSASASQSEYAIDRAHKIGFFVDHFEFCMTRKDV